MKLLAVSAAILMLTQLALAQEEPHAPKEILRQAMELHESGDLEGAIRQYEAFLTLHPDVANVADVRSNLGAAYLSTGNHERALAALERALELGNASNPANLRFNLGSAYFKAGDVAKAEAVLTSLVAEQPGDKEAILLLASCYQWKNDIHKIVELLSPLESELDQDPQFAYVLGIAMIKDGQIEHGERHAATVMSHGNEARARVMLGTARQMSGEYFRAEEEFKRAIELNPKLPAVNGTYGLVLQVLARPDDADKAFCRELEINPNDFDSNFNHGIYLYKYEQKYEESLAHLQRALRSRPDHRDVQFQIGLVYSLKNEIEKALEILREIVEESPNSLEGHSTLTRLYYRLNKREEAERHRATTERLRKDQDGQRLIQQGRLSEALGVFRQLKQKDPTGRSHFFAGMILSLMNDWTAAAVDLKEALRLDPENPKYIISYTNALARLGQVELAMEILGAVKPEWVAPLSPDAMLTLSETYHWAKRHDEALQVLDVMARRDPNSARINLLRGQIHLVKGDYELARQFAETSIERLPTNNALAYSILGMARYQLDDTAGAKEAHLEAVSQDPGNAEYLWKLGAVCLAMGESGSAIQYLMLATPGAEQFPEIYAALAKAYEAENNPAKANQALQQYEAITKK